MSLERDRIDALEIENDELRERVRQLEAELYGDQWYCPIEFGLTVAEAKILAALVHRERGSKEYLHRATIGEMGKETEPKIVDVFVCKMRKKLKPFGVEIHTLWGIGYYLDTATREALKAGTFLSEEAA